MAAFKYEFSIKGYHKVEAQVIGEMLEDMEQKGIEITPENGLNASRDESSPAHDEFEWDDNVAAEKYRLEQARNLIVHIRIVREESEVHEYDPSTEHKPTNEYMPRGFVPIPGGNSVYVPMHVALGKEEYREHLLKQARNDSEVFLAKYRTLEELAEVTEAMNKFLSVG